MTTQMDRDMFEAITYLEPKIIISNSLLMNQQPLMMGAMMSIMQTKAYANSSI